MTSTGPDDRRAETHTRHRRGLTVHHRQVPGAPRVVLVHGAMDRAGGFVKVLRRLHHLDLIRYDRRGYAESRTGTVHDTIEGHVEDLFAVMDDEPAVVVGHSLGGVVALAAAETRPDLVPSVAAFEPPLAWRSWWPTRYATTKPVAPEDAAEIFLRRVLSDDLWERMPPAMQRARRDEGPALVADLTAVRHASSVDPAFIRVPVLTGHGSATHERHRHAAEIIAEEAPDGEVMVIEGAGHGAHYTHPVDFGRFVDRAVARAGS